MNIFLVTGGAGFIGSHLGRDFGVGGEACKVWRVAGGPFTLERMIREYDQLYSSIRSAAESPQ